LKSEKDLLFLKTSAELEIKEILPIPCEKSCRSSGLCLTKVENDLFIHTVHVVGEKDNCRRKLVELKVSINSKNKVDDYRRTEAETYYEKNGEPCVI